MVAYLLEHECGDVKAIFAIASKRGKGLQRGILSVVLSTIFIEMAHLYYLPPSIKISINPQDSVATIASFGLGGAGCDHIGRLERCLHRF